MAVIEISCTCGATMKVTAEWVSSTKEPRAEFWKAHAVCLERQLCPEEYDQAYVPGEMGVITTQVVHVGGFYERGMTYVLTEQRVA